MCSLVLASFNFFMLVIHIFSLDLVIDHSFSLLDSRPLCDYYHNLLILSTLDGNLKFPVKGYIAGYAAMNLLVHGLMVEIDM